MRRFTARLSIIILAGGISPEIVPAQEPAPQTAGEASSRPEPSAEATPAPANPAGAIEAMSDGELDAAIGAIQRLFLDSKATDASGMRRATLAGLIDRLEPGLRLTTPSHADPEPPPFLAEILDGHIGYIRPGSLDVPTQTQFDTTLASFVHKEVDALVLDLRVANGSDFETAAEMARRLTPRGQVLFTLEKPSAKQERIFTSHNDPDFDGTLVVLTDGRTSGAAEALAGALRGSAGAMVIGERTSGAAVEMEKVRLGDSESIEIATSHVLLADGFRIYPHGLRPDIEVETTDEEMDAILKHSGESGISRLVYVDAPTRFNEASLVARTNPEFDRATGQVEAPLQDEALQRAVDLVIAIQFYHSQSTQ